MGQYDTGHSSAPAEEGWQPASPPRGGNASGDGPPAPLQGRAVSSRLIVATPSALSSDLKRAKAARRASPPARVSGVSGGEGPRG